MKLKNSWNYFRFNNLLLGYLFKKVLAQHFIYYLFCVEIETWEDESNKWNTAHEKVKMQ